MNYRRSRKKGFTLIEILIVVVVIGVLAALILPRMLSSPEKAMAAEANQMLGSIIRSQHVNVDTGGVFVTLADNTTSSDWAKLGMRAPGASVVSGSGPKFDYTCQFVTCKAVRSGSGDPTLSAKAMTVGTDDVWNCNPNLADPAFYKAAPNGGCVVV